MDIIVLETTDQQLWCVFVHGAPCVCVYVCVWDKFQHTAGNVLEIRIFYPIPDSISTKYFPKNISLFLETKFILLPREFLFCFIYYIFLYTAKVQEHLSWKLYTIIKYPYFICLYIFHLAIGLVGIKQSLFFRHFCSYKG